MSVLFHMILASVEAAYIVIYFAVTHSTEIVLGGFCCVGAYVCIRKVWDYRVRLHPATRATWDLMIRLFQAEHVQRRSRSCSGRCGHSGF
jgi:hypothetical protein